MKEIRLAEKTRDAIDTAIYRDQGRTYRGFLREHILDVDDAYNSDEKDRFRGHFGVSMSGRECARELWYKWHWATPVAIPGKTLRLFNRGHLEEARFVAMFRTIGCEVYQAYEEGKQFQVSMFGGHYGSAIDGVVRGIPEMPDEPLLAEMKTHGDKSFKKLAGEKDSQGNVVKLPQGLFVSKIEHYVQMQQYMGYFGLAFGIYCAVNKNTDELYFEIIEYDAEFAAQCVERSRRIIFAIEAPPRITENPQFWKCKFCDERRVCHYQAAPDFNCRSCAAARPRDDGTWYCHTHESVIDKERQLTGCPEWQQHESFQK